LKKYRCPYCGEECIPLIDKCICIEWKTSFYVLKQGNACRRCNNHFGKRYIYKWCDYVFPWAYLLIFGLFGLTYLNISVLAIIFLVYSFSLILVILPLVEYIFTEVTQFDQEKLKSYTLPPNAEIEISTDKIRIRNLSILGIKFNKKTNVVRFHETFTNDLVPVVFYKGNKKQQGKLKVTIMKMEFIPKDLLFEGSEFTVIDNGKEIATAKIIKVYESK